jgi:hypothetical protein
MVIAVPGVLRDIFIGNFDIKLELDYAYGFIYAAGPAGE